MNTPSTRTGRNVLVVGLGYVGLPIAVRAASVGYEVTGVDVSPTKIEAITSGTSYVEDVTDEELVELTRSGALKVHTIDRTPTPFDFALITVPTPVDELKKPDLSFIKSAARFVATHMTGGETVILESTTYPGTTEDVVAHVIREMNGMTPGVDYHLGYSPERINPGDPVHTFRNVPKIVSGVGEEALRKVQLFYDTLVDRTVPVSGPRAAELAKVFENTFAQVNIGLVNELALVCSELGLDVDEVLDAAATKGHAIMRFRPGVGVGGHCIAVDPLYLTWMRREYHGKAFQFAELADEVNKYMPMHVVFRVKEILTRRKVPIWESRIMLLGLAYKPGVADVRESPSLELLHLLQDAGATVTALDPHVNTPEDVTTASKTADQHDLVIIATAHHEFDYPTILRNAAVILDTRNCYPPRTPGVEKL